MQEKKDKISKDNYSVIISLRLLIQPQKTEGTLTLYLVPLRGWTVLYPAHRCRTESFYCSPQHTVKKKKFNGCGIMGKYCNTNTICSHLYFHTRVTCFFHPYLLILARLGIDSQPSNLDSKRSENKRKKKKSKRCIHNKDHALITSKVDWGGRQGRVMIKRS